MADSEKIRELKRENKRLIADDKVLKGCIRNMQGRLESYERTCGELANEVSQLRATVAKLRDELTKAKDVQ
jgi:SMC interacting uncharacterized protein involved in chromosome segregation